MSYDCRCTLHPRRPHTDPCRACQKNHGPVSRAADGRTAPSPQRREDPHRQPEVPERGMASDTSRTPNGTRAAGNGQSRTVPTLGASSSGT